MAVACIIALSLALSFTSCSDGSSGSSDDEKPTYTVTFDANGGTGTMNPQIFAYGEPQNLSPNKFSVDGKDFLGWAKTSGGSIAYDDNSEYTIGAADVTLYAVWGKFVTADNAATVIAGLESGTSENPNVYTIKITDKTLTAEQQKEIGTALYTKFREENDWYGFISLDLSSATGITEIPEEAFSYSCLSGLILPDSLETIGIAAFRGNIFEETVIPDNVKSIEKGSFWGCSSLKTITLPASLVSIGASAFKNCASLKTVNYKGTQAQWEALKSNISDGNEKLTGANIVYNYTGE
ncbi:MAG: leucine-rich repeat protein [Spirochaetales bacterium]|nr:leucine-rich repeat protein [Spirochaetales bacterium]